MNRTPFALMCGPNTPGEIRYGPPCTPEALHSWLYDNGDEVAGDPPHQPGVENDPYLDSIDDKEWLDAVERLQKCTKPTSELFMLPNGCMFIIGVIEVQPC